MSLSFSDTTNKNGIIQKIERNTLLGDGVISGNTTLLKQFTADVNLGIDKVFGIIFKADGRWQADDSNHEKYPILTMALVSGQRDYSFTTDQQGNLILDIYKVLSRVSTSGIYQELDTVDVQSDDVDSMTNGLDLTGIPTKYDKTANGFFLDPVPNFSATDGLKVYINREGSYFTSDDTSKKPGFAGLFHEYLALYASYPYCREHGLENAAGLQTDMLLMEKEIEKHYSRRAKDERPGATMKKINFR